MLIGGVGGLLPFPKLLGRQEPRLSQPHLTHGIPAGGKCPSSHPVAIPRVETFLRYAVGTAPIGTISFDSGPYYTAHQDFFNGWIAADLQKLVTRCINAGVDCGTNPTP